MNAKQLLLEKFLDGTFAGMTDDEICDELEIRGKDKRKIRDMLHDLAAEGKLYHDYFFRFGTAEQLGAVKGKIQGNPRGFAFLIPTDPAIGHDFFIPARFLHGAYHGDTVYAVPVKSEKNDDEAEVIAVLERGMKEIVGTFYRDKNFGFLRPDEKRFSDDIFIPLKKCKDIPAGVKAVARITDYPKDRAPGGEIVEILQAENEFFLEELSIIRAHSLREEFPDLAMRQARKASERKITQEDILARKDLRKQLVITIDGEDTRDIDDAVSVEREGENYRLGVHIADVSEYVPLHGELDKEALRRGTSVYFPDRVLPMLPKELSNGICSLNEGEERLTLSCLMTVDKNGKVVDSEIVKSVIRSAHRMTYTEVTAIAEGDEKTCEKYPDLLDFVATAVELTNVLTAMRAKKGYVALDVKELHVILNKDGKIEIPDYERTISHEMIEQFMVLANETVAEYMESISAPFVYRVHEKPSEEKAGEFKEFLRSLNIPCRLNPEDVHPYDYRNILQSLEGDPVYPVVNRVMLRSMMKAKYSPVNAGHFGLSSACYCHFTSPIRRYPDLCIHRIIKEVLDGNYERACAKYNGLVAEVAAKSSAAEKNAQEAERQVDDLYAVTYLIDHVGEEYDAVLSGVTAFGLFAELKNGVEGFIPIETLPEDEYEYIESKYRLNGRNHAFRMGESVRIRVAACHLDTLRAEFQLLLPENE